MISKLVSPFSSSFFSVLYLSSTIKVKKIEAYLFVNLHIRLSWSKLRKLKRASHCFVSCWYSKVCHCSKPESLLCQVSQLSRGAVPALMQAEWEDVLKHSAEKTGHREEETVPILCLFLCVHLSSCYVLIWTYTSSPSALRYFNWVKGHVKELPHYVSKARTIHRMQQQGLAVSHMITWSHNSRYALNNIGNQSHVAACSCTVVQNQSVCSWSCVPWTKYQSDRN